MSVQATTLKSGLVVLTHAMPHLQSASIGTWVRAGSRSENPSEHGISHFLEHMAFKGTKQRTARQIAEQIEDVGGEVNASTSVENTGYYARLLQEDVGLGLDILADILQNSVFDDRELETEKHVIAQEIGAAHDSPDDYVFDLFQQAAFGNQAIGRNILGTVETVNSFDKSQIKDFLKRNYLANRTVFAAAGNVDHDTIITDVATKFDHLSSCTDHDPQPARYVGGDIRVTRDLEQTHLVLGLEGRAYNSDGFYALQFLAAILGGGMSSRLFQHVREQRGLCYSIYAFHWAFADTGVFAISTSTSADDVEELMPVVLQQLQRSTDDITDKEVQRVRNQIKAGLVMSLESPAARVGQLARQQLLWGRPVPIEETLERISAIDAARVREVAEQIMASKPSLAAVGPVDRVMGYDDIRKKLSG